MFVDIYAQGERSGYQIRDSENGTNQEIANMIVHLELAKLELLDMIHHDFEIFNTGDDEDDE